MDFTKSLKAQLGEYAKAFNQYETRDDITFLTCEPDRTKNYVFLNVIIRVAEIGIYNGFDKSVRSMVIIRYNGKIEFKYARHGDYSTKKHAYTYTKVPTFDKLCKVVDSEYRKYLKEFYEKKNADTLRAIEFLPG